MIQRNSALMVVAVLVASTSAPGCKSLSSIGPRRIDTVQAPPTPSVNVLEVVQRHNENARLVQGLKTPDLTARVETYQQNGRDRRVPFFAGRASGYMAVEQPKNLRLVLQDPRGGDLIDIGSNASGFWLSDGMNKQIIVGRYEDLGQNPLTAAIQPEWVLDMLGLREIPETVAASAQKRDQGRIIVLSERRGLGSVGELTKETYIDAQTGYIREHRLIDGQSKKVLAKAIIPRESYRELPLSDGQGSSILARVPTQIQLHLADMADVTLALANSTVNPTNVNPDLFVEPSKERDGYVRSDIRSLFPEAQAFAATTTRPASASDRLYESTPRPPTGNSNSRLNRASNTAVTARQRQDRDEMDAVPLLGTEVESREVRAEAIVEPGIPRGSDTIQRTSTWRASSGSRFPPEVAGRRE